MKQRIYYLDSLRSYAIAFVVMLHCVVPFLTNTSLIGSTTWKLSLFLNAVCRAGVPLFFMVSGFLHLSAEEEGGMFAFYRKKLPRLITPLLAWNLIYYVANTLLFHQEKLHISVFLNHLVNRGSEYHLWFMYTLISIYLIIPFLKTIAKKLPLSHVVILFLIVIFPGTIRTLVNNSLPIYVYLFDPLFEGYIGYFLLGYILGKMDISKMKLYLFSLGIPIGIAYSVVFNYITTTEHVMNLPANGGYAINSYLIAGGIFVIMRYTITSRQSLMSKISGLLATNSFGVYWVHVMVLSVIIKIWDATLPLLISMLLWFAITMMISVFISIVLSKVPYIKRLFVVR